MSKWLLIDGFNIAFRSFYGIPDLTRSDGFPTNAIHGFLRTLWYLEDKEKPDNIIVFFDLGGSHARKALMEKYKANRNETPEGLVQQIPWLKKLSAALGYQVIEREGVEADDLIGSAALQLVEAGHEAYIVSADKDLAQLIQPGIKQLLPPPTANPKLGWRLLDEEGVFKKYGIPPEKIVDYLSLIGDSSDNIPGVPGVGPKTALKWIETYGSVETVIEKANYLQPARFQLIVPKHANQLQINLKMIELHTNQKIELLGQTQPNKEETVSILDTMEMSKASESAKKRLA